MIGMTDNNRLSLKSTDDMTDNHRLSLKNTDDRNDRQS